MGGVSSSGDDKEEEGGLSDPASESDSHRFRFGAGALPLFFFWGGPWAWRGGGMLAPSLSSFTSLPSPPPIPRQSAPSSHPNHPTSPKCAHKVGL